MFRGRSFLICTALTAGLLAFQSCSREPSPGPAEITSIPGMSASDKTGDDDHQAYLEDLWLRGENLPMDKVIDVTFLPKDGCDVSGVPETWAELYPTYRFHLRIAPGAIETEGDQPVTISISVPSLDAITFDPDAPQVMVMDPYASQHLTVDPPAELIVAFHPHLRPTCGEYCFFGIEQTGNMYEATDPAYASSQYSMPAKGLAGGPGGIVDPLVKCANGIALEVKTFNGSERVDRWELVNDDGGDGGDRNTPCEW